MVFFVLRRNRRFVNGYVGIFTQNEHVHFILKPRAFHRQQPVKNIVGKRPKSRLSVFELYPVEQIKQKRRRFIADFTYFNSFRGDKNEGESVFYAGSPRKN